MEQTTMVIVADRLVTIVESDGGRHPTLAATKAGGAHDSSLERQERCERNSIHVTTQQTQRPADAASRGVRLRAMRRGRCRHGPGHRT